MPAIGTAARRAATLSAMIRTVTPPRRGGSECECEWLGGLGRSPVVWWVLNGAGARQRVWVRWRHAVGLAPRMAGKAGAADARRGAAGGTARRSTHGQQSSGARAEVSAERAAALLWSRAALFVREPAAGGIHERLPNGRTLRARDNIHEREGHNFDLVPTGASGAGTAVVQVVEQREGFNLCHDAAPSPRLRRLVAAATSW